jgi:hypothetical protein
MEGLTRKELLYVKNTVLKESVIAIEYAIAAVDAKLAKHEI